MFKAGDVVELLESVHNFNKGTRYIVVSGEEEPNDHEIPIHSANSFNHLFKKVGKNTFTVKEGQIEAAARFIVANNSYMHGRTTNEMIQKIKRTIKRMVDDINDAQDAWYTITAGYVVTIMKECDNYYVVEVLVDPVVSQNKEFINVEEII